MRLAAALPEVLFLALALAVGALLAPPTPLYPLPDFSPPPYVTQACLDRAMAIHDGDVVTVNGIDCRDVLGLRRPVP